LGDARRWNEDLDGAKAAYHKALALAAAYEYVSNWLFDLAMEANDLDEAGRILEHALAHHPTEFMIAREVQWCARRREFQRAQAALEKLTGRRFANRWPLSAAIEAFQQAGWARAARALLDDATRRGDVDPQVFEQWVVLCAQGGAWRACAKRLDELAAAGAGWFAAASEFLSQLGQRGMSAHAKRFVLRHAELLRLDGPCWGSVGFALCYHQPQFVVDWMSDWRRREVARPWMLANLADAYGTLGRDAEAIEAHQAALAQPPDHSWQLHCAMLAAYYAAAGRWDEIPALTEQVDFSQLDAHHRAALSISRDTLTVRDWLQQRRGWRNVWRAARMYWRLAAPHRLMWATRPLLRRLAAAARRRMAGELAPRLSWLFWRGFHV
jgi:tetratricopeptide (TPR) repeat protein